MYLYSASSRSASNALPLPIRWCWSPLPVLQPGTSKHCNTTDTGWCITQYACLLPQLSPGTHSSLTMDGQLMLSRPGCWFCTEVVHLSTQASPTCYRYTKPATKPSGTSVPSTSSFPALRWTVPCCATYVSTHGAAQLIDTTSFEDSNANALCNVSIAALTTDSTLAHRSINSADRSIPHDTYTCYRVHSSLP